MPSQQELPQTEKSMTDKQEHPGYYAVIPAGVRYNKSICPSARLLYAEITSLCNKYGFCWASNKYFACLYEVDNSSVSKWVKSLSEAGHIKIEYEYAYDTGKPRITKRKLYLTERLPWLIPAEKVRPSPAGELTGQVPDQILAEQTSDGQTPVQEDQLPAEEEGGIEITQQGVLKYINRGIEITQQGIEKTQRRILKANIKRSSSSPPGNEKPEQTGPPGKEAEAFDLKQEFRRVDPALVFSEPFYPKAAEFLETHAPGSGYLSWLYEFCKAKKPQDIAGYYFTVFFEPRLVELYREHLRSRSPPPDIPCPVCGKEHPADRDCPVCGFRAACLNDPEETERHKRLYFMPEDKRKAYEAETGRLIKDRPRYSLDEYFRLLRMTAEKYGLSDPEPEKDRVHAQKEFWNGVY